MADILKIVLIFPAQVVVVHNFSPSTLKAEEGGLSSIEVSLVYSACFMIERATQKNHLGKQTTQNTLVFVNYLPGQGQYSYIK